jgi:hypothetical protein
VAPLNSSLLTITLNLLVITTKNIPSLLWRYNRGRLYLPLNTAKHPKGSSLKFYLPTWIMDCNFNNHETYKCIPPAKFPNLWLTVTRRSWHSRKTVACPTPVMAAVVSIQPRRNDFRKLINRHATPSKYLPTRISFENEYWCWRLILRPAVYRQSANGAANVTGSSRHRNSVPYARQFCISILSQFLSKLGQWLVKSKLWFKCFFGY